MLFYRDAWFLQQQIKIEFCEVIHKARSKTRYDLYTCLPKDLQHLMDIASEKGASSWLTALPLAKYGFALHKRVF